jgi:hypothetical protein
MSTDTCAFEPRQRGDYEAQRDDTEMHQCENAYAQALQCRQCRGASAAMPIHKRGNTKVPARQHQRDNFEASAWQCRCAFGASPRRRYFFSASPAPRACVG